MSGREPRLMGRKSGAGFEPRDRVCARVKWILSQFAYLSLSPVENVAECRHPLASRRRVHRLGIAFGVRTERAALEWNLGFPITTAISRRATVPRLGISALPDDPPLVVNVRCLPGLPGADVGQAFVKRLGIVPDGQDRPLAVGAHIAVLPSGLVAICRHQREPIGK